MALDIEAFSLMEYHEDRGNGGVKFDVRLFFKTVFLLFELVGVVW